MSNPLPGSLWPGILGTIAVKIHEFHELGFRPEALLFQLGRKQCEQMQIACAIYSDRGVVRAERANIPNTIFEFMGVRGVFVEKDDYLAITIDLQIPKYHE